VWANLQRNQSERDFSSKFLARHVPPCSSATAENASSNASVLGNCGSGVYDLANRMTTFHLKTFRSGFLVSVVRTVLLYCLLPIAGFVPLIASNAAVAEDDLLAPTPPMGWNSWDSYAQSIDESHIRATAAWMAEHLKKFGWQYVVIDEGWYRVNLDAAKPEDFRFAMDGDGRFVPVAERFRSAAGEVGFKALADSVHALGLKFGIHMIRGIPREAVVKNLTIADSKFHAADAADMSDTCPWNSYNYGVKNNEAGQAYYDSIAKLYASWGVDFVKADCISDHPYKGEEIRMLSVALKKSGRPMVLSLSPGPTALDKAGEVARYAEMWRISDDFWDHWGVWAKHEWSAGLHDQFATMAKWGAMPSVPGHWPDADMLPIGHLGPHPGDGEFRDTKFTRDEQRTLLTLWAMFRSPLMMGGNLLSCDEWTLSLLTNPEVIEVDQHSRERRQVLSRDNAVVWTARPESGDEYYVAVFNVGEGEQTLRYEWKDLGMEPGGYQVRDLWTATNLQSAHDLTVTLKAHASVLYKVRRVLKLSN
jgi:alpha-galactosidase